MLIYWQITTGPGFYMTYYSTSVNALAINRNEPISDPTGSLIVVTVPVTTIIVSITLVLVTVTIAFIRLVFWVRRTIIQVFMLIYSSYEILLLLWCFTNWPIPLWLSPANIYKSLSLWSIC